MALTTISAVKEFLGITNSDSDTVLTSLIDYASTAIEKYCNRLFNEAERTKRLITDGDIVDYYLDYPIDLTKDFIVTWKGEDGADDRIYNEAEYDVNDELGIIRFDYPPAKRINRLEIQYTAGYSTIPSDLEFATIRIVSAMFKSGGGGNEEGIGSGKEVGSERLGDYNVSYIAGDSTGGQSRSSITQLIYNERLTLDSYKRINI